MYTASNEQCHEVRWQNGCLQAFLTCYKVIGRMPVNEKARGFRVALRKEK